MSTTAFNTLDAFKDIIQSGGLEEQRVMQPTISSSQSWSLKFFSDDEIIRIEVITFDDSIYEIFTTGDAVNRGSSVPFFNELFKNGIGFKNVKRFTVENMEGVGGTFGRHRRGVQRFKRLD